MEPWGFSDGNITDLLECRSTDPLRDVNPRLQMHSSLVQRLSLDKDMKGHQGCINAISWNSKGTLLISGSDDTRINLWSYSNRELIHSIETGHSANIFCTKFIPETCDGLVASGAGDAEVRVFNISCLGGIKSDDIFLRPSAVFQCHARRVKKLATEIGNANVVWSASEDGTLRQHDFREGASCPPAGSSSQECRSVLLDLRCGAKRSLASPPKQCLALKSCDISSTRPHQILVGGSDSFARLYDRRMLPPSSSCRTKMKPPPCVSYFCPMHLSDRRRASIHLTHVAFSPNGEEVLLSYSGEHVYLMDVISGEQRVGYTASDVSKLISLATTPEVSESPSASSSYFTESKKNLRKLDMYKKLVQAAEKILNEGSNFLYGIEACNEVFDGKGPEIGDALKHEALCIRAALLLKRKWKNDVHMAIRDCNRARNIDPSSFKAHYYMSEALIQVGKHKEGLEFALAAQNIAPSNPLASERVLSIRDRLAAGEQRVGYTASDVSKLISLATTPEVSESPSASSSYFTESKKNLRKLDMYKKLVQAAEKILNEGSNFLYGIEACNEVFDGKGPEIGDALKHEALCIRAALLLKRKWKNDVHMAIRDCNRARNIDPSSFKAHYYMSEALIQVGKHKEGLEFALAAQNIAPSNPLASERVLSIRDRLAAGEQRVGYTASDVSKLISLATTPEVSESPSASSSYFTESKKNLRKLDMYKKLVQAAEKILNEGSNFLYGIEACNEVFDGKGPEIGDALKHEALCIRAALLLKRKWKNDVHMAIRDCNRARNIDPSSFKAHYYMSEALIQVGKHKEGLEFALAAQNIAPSNPLASERVLSIRDRLAADEAEKNCKDHGGTRKREICQGRVRSLSDVLFRSESNNEESQEGPNEREDSDYEGEMELDFETSISGDEGHDIESSILRGRLNLRFHRNDEPNKENSNANGSQGSPSLSSQHDKSAFQHEAAIDMKQRYVGHCNVGTDIKQASFLGQRGEFVTSGSDDGRWFIWETTTGRLIKMLAGDDTVVNCVQCHPFDCAVATSGIDNTIKIWTPHAEVPSMVAGGTAGPETADILSAIEINQRKLRRNREAILPIEILEQLRMHEFEFAEGTFHPFECAQS